MRCQIVTWSLKHDLQNPHTKSGSRKKVGVLSFLGVFVSVNRNMKIYWLSRDSLLNIKGDKDKVCVRVWGGEGRRARREVASFKEDGGDAFCV